VSEQQTVVDTTKTPAEPGVTGNNAPGDVDPLDQLLAEYDQGTKKPDTVTPPETKVETPQAPPVVPERIMRLERKLLQEDINKAAENIFGDLKIPHRARIGWLHQMANENPAIDRAFQNKENDPKTWARFEKSLQREAAKEFTSNVDERATEDHAAVAAAVRGASTKVAAEPPPNLAHMSDAELREYTRKNFGF
jgi:hypothetical protein